MQLIVLLAAAISHQVRRPCPGPALPRVTAAVGQALPQRRRPVVAHPMALRTGSLVAAWSMVGRVPTAAAATPWMVRTWVGPSLRVCRPLPAGWRQKRRQQR
jgi:hypothetical protein